MKIKGYFGMITNSLLDHLCSSFFSVNRARVTFQVRTSVTNGNIITLFERFSVLHGRRSYGGALRCAVFYPKLRMWCDRNNSYDLPFCGRFFG